MATPFDRDLGYLDAFLGKLRAHAATLPAERRAALEELLRSQGDAWTEVRTLLEGNAPPGPAAPGPSAAPAPAEPAPGTWTVGTLRGGRG